MHYDTVWPLAVRCVWKQKNLRAPMGCQVAIFFFFCNISKEEAKVFLFQGACRHRIFFFLYLCSFSSTILNIIKNIHWLLNFFLSHFYLFFLCLQRNWKISNRKYLSMPKRKVSMTTCVYHHHSIYVVIPEEKKRTTAEQKDKRRACFIESNLIYLSHFYSSSVRFGFFFIHRYG